MLCTRCGRRDALPTLLLCKACKAEFSAKPKVTTYDRKPPEPEFDFWRIAHDLLYPDKTYRALTKAERVRVQRMARVLANIPYAQPEPRLDDETKSLVTAHLLVGRRLTVGQVDTEAFPEDDDDDD